MVRNYSFSGRINEAYQCLDSCTFEDSLVCDKAALCNKGLQIAIDDRLSHMKEYGGIDATIEEVDSFFVHPDVYSPLLVDESLVLDVVAGMCLICQKKMLNG